MDNDAKTAAMPPETSNTKLICVSVTTSYIESRMAHHDRE